MDELSALYRAETTGTPASLPPLWMEYGDYAVWQRDVVRGEELDRLLGYWRGQLHGAPQVLTLPADRTRPARLSSRGAVAKVTVDAATTRRLGEVAYGANATMFMVFLTGFVAVLSRYTRQTDIVTGTQVAGRTHTELDPIVGMFTNTLPLRISLAGDPTFVELLGRVRDTTLDALAHQQIPFEKLVEEFVPDRSLGELAAHPGPVRLRVAHAARRWMCPASPRVSRALLTGTAKLDVTVYADTQDSETTTLVMEYATDLFSPAWADRFLGCLAQLLGHAAEAPGTAGGRPAAAVHCGADALIVGRNLPVRPARSVAGDVRRLLQASASRVIDGDETLPMSRGVRPGRPARPGARRSRRRPGDAGRALRRTRHRHADRAARRCGGPAARTYRWIRAFRRRGWPRWRAAPGCGSSSPTPRTAIWPASVADGATVICVDDPGDGGGVAARPGAGAGQRARVRHLHLGLDRPAQGRRHRAPGGGEPARVVPARAHARPRRPVRRRHHAVVRHRPARAAAARGRWRRPRDRDLRRGPRARPAAVADRADGRDRDAGDAADLAPAGLGRRRAGWPATAAVRRRGSAGRPRRAG